MTDDKGGLMTPPNLFPEAAEAAAAARKSGLSHADSPYLGTWDVKISTPTHPEWTAEFHGLLALSTDGIAFSSNAADITIGLGSWYPEADGGFCLFRRSNFIDITGVLSTLNTIHHGKLTAPGTFHAVGFGKMYDPKGEYMYDIENVHINGQRY